MRADVAAAPVATYRLQLTPAFGFDAAAERMPYLARLGVSHAYLSPISEAVAGSSHGYDVADPTRLREELGGEAGFRRLVAAARQAGVLLMVDVVPNHMAADPAANPWWRDLLEDGEQSPYADWFDVEWRGADPELEGRVVVPVLARSLDATIAAGEATPAREGGEFVLQVPGINLPLGLETVAGLLDAAAAGGGGAGLEDAAAQARRLPRGTTTALRRRRLAARRAIHLRLGAVCRDDPDAAGAVDRELAATADDTGRLRALVGEQAWVLDGWRQGTLRLDYRRFFTVTSLVGMRAERAEVREAGMRRVLRLVRDGSVAALRVDHVDGLRQPGDWLAWLQRATGGAWTVVEKILGHGETLPRGWACDGTTGYEFGALLAALSVDPHGLRVLEVLRDDVAGARPEFAELARSAKLEMLDSELAPEWARLLRRLDAVADADAALSELPRDLLAAALRELLVSLRVYRTYVGEDGAASDADRAALETAIAFAGVEGRLVPRDVLELVAGRLLGDRWQGRRSADLVAAFQQLAPALMAKGVEDTALYRETALLARADVGCDPDRPPATPADFHAWCEQARARAPRSLLATSTHDTKRSEDVRARLCALSALATDWAPAVRGWAERFRALDPGGDALNVLLQTLVGAWPIDAGRATAYMIKAMREAKERTSWTGTVEIYESRMGQMVAELLGDADFVGELERVVERVRPIGERISLAWTLLRLTAPGVPDTYQGCELWDLSLVDPDNRRPVDFDGREALLDRARGASPAELLAAPEGLAKLAVVVRALDLRRRRPAAFGPDGAHRRLDACGPHADRCVAFARGEPAASVTVAPHRPPQAWEGTSITLPAGPWVDVLGGREVAGGGGVELDRLLDRFPVALLERA